MTVLIYVHIYDFLHICINMHKLVVRVSLRVKVGLLLTSYHSWIRIQLSCLINSFIMYLSVFEFQKFCGSLYASKLILLKNSTIALEIFKRNWNSTWVFSPRWVFNQRCFCHSPPKAFPSDFSPLLEPYYCLWAMF